MKETKSPCPPSTHLNPHPRSFSARISHCGYCSRSAVRRFRLRLADAIVERQRAAKPVEIYPFAWRLANLGKDFVLTEPRPSAMRNSWWLTQVPVVVDKRVHRRR